MSILARYRQTPNGTQDSLLTNLSSSLPTTDSSPSPPPPSVVSTTTTTTGNNNDFDCSVDILYQGFIVWHRLQRDGIVRQQTRDDVLQQFDLMPYRYPDTFTILHRGSRCPESLVIGKGKYSTVYQRQNYAFKVIRVLRSEKDISVLRCNIKELGYFHSLSHPNIMRCSQSQLVMEHGSIHKIIHQMQSARCNLQHMIDAHEITCFQDLVYIFNGIARGLQYMHSLSVVHGDVKPSNILINHQYRPMLSDFTLTTCEGKGNEIAFGTLFWRSPECLLARSCQRSSDVWSFGMILLDCIYGCTYMMTVMNGKDDHDILGKLACIINPPDDEWIQINLNPAEQKDLIQNLLHPDPVWCDHVTGHNQLQIPLTSEELEIVQDLVSKILVWDATKRPTMDEVLQHPMFTRLTPVTPFPEANVFKTKLLPVKPPTPTDSSQQQHPAFQITWRDSSEREYIRRWAKFYYMEHFKHNIPESEDWLLQDVSVLSKRIIDHLRVIECTFNLKNIIKVCSEFMYFIWKDMFITDNPLFESQMFHILNLLKFVIFPFHVQERFIQATNPTATV